MLEANALAYTVGSGEGMTKWGRSGGKGVLIDGLVGDGKVEIPGAERGCQVIIGCAVRICNRR